MQKFQAEVNMFKKVIKKTVYGSVSDLSLWAPLYILDQDH